EGVLAILDFRDGQQLFDRELERLVWERRRHEAAALAGLDVADLAFIDREDHAIASERRDFEQHLAARDRGANHLAEIAGYDHAIDRRTHLHPRELRVEQLGLR